jgi:DNA (cytosine-5)-methyltransferase 1
MTQGFVEAGGFEPVFAVDFDEAACRTYAANFGEHVLCAPIESIAVFPQADVVIGGPPCQGFSNLGKRDPGDPRNQLWRHYFRAVEQARPRVLVMENVPELLRSPEFQAFRERVGALGYSVEAKVLNSADFGVPQRRKRAIVLAWRDGEPIYPQPTHTENPEDDAARLPWCTVRDAIGDLPLEPTGSDWHIGRNPLASSVERYQAVPEGGNRWDLYRNRPDLTPGCWIRKTSGGTDLFGRLWWDRPAFTIRTEFYKPEKGRYLHPTADRPITHREAARLQSFPDEFKWVGSKIEVARQIGNAVPCGLARAIANSVRSMLETRTAAPSDEQLEMRLVS